MVPPPPPLAVASAEVSEVDSLRGHLAWEAQERDRSDGELWIAYRRLADCYQTLVLEFAWLRRRQWSLMGLVACGQLAIGGAVAFLIWRVVAR